jgi:transaldolase/glucose-6-phosphate isomerase
VSRIDAAVEKAGAPEELHGKVAIANARKAYSRFRRRFVGSRWEALAGKGARPQRLLWASTGTKNKAFSDVLYVEELIGADTVNTLPPATLEAFRDHGKVRASLEDNLTEADRVMAGLMTAGISIEEIADNLVKDGVKAFAESMDKILEAVAHKRPAAKAQAAGGRI